MSVYSDQAVERLNSRINPTTWGCATYDGYRNPKGYGRLSMDGQMVYAHRAVAEIRLGRKLLPGEVVLHICDTPPCCHPDHLIVGTLIENTADMVAKGRNARGNLRERRLKKEDVLKIRLALAFEHSKNSIATRFGCSERLVRHIDNGTAWKGVRLEQKPSLWKDPFLEEAA